MNFEFKKPFVIADVGSNWKATSNDSDNLVMAKRHIHDAARAGCSAVKFQLFTDKELFGFAGTDKYSLPREWIIDLASYASSQNIEFMCTAFSEDGYKLVNDFVNVHKVASSEMKHVGILDLLKKMDKPTLISTGGAHVMEIEWLCQEYYSQKVGLLECVAAYPAESKSYNLGILQKKVCITRETEGAVPDEMVVRPFVGVSDHTLEDVVALAGVGAGATVFEKHFTCFDWADVWTPDKPVSIGPQAMKDYVRKIQLAYLAVQPRRKKALPEEKDMTLRHRRRLKVIAPVKAGDGMFIGKNFGIFRSITEDTTAGPPEAWTAFEDGTALKDMVPGDPVWTTTVQPHGTDE